MITLNYLLDNRESIEAGIKESMTEEGREAMLEMLTICEYDIPLTIEVGAQVLREAAMTKNGSAIIRHTLQIDSSVDIGIRLDIMDMLFVDELTEFILLLILHVVDDTICIEDYVDIEDAE